ncbi:P12 [Operophtera brumata nucleopolyhedrovirus]|uniref:P12 n=1 Tax=Operophtera brumata nucleopolyhedrovirus TaxID=1046267 RepID=A0A2H4UZX2_9ABAC|nr:P12 [Operophtera brumata nucleopolyhedrovirus]AUA60317.1 P12 [Operophtera brumata nucleopolyhedrovirus]
MPSTSFLDTPNSSSSGASSSETETDTRRRRRNVSPPPARNVYAEIVTLQDVLQQNSTAKTIIDDLSENKVSSLFQISKQSAVATKLFENIQVGNEIRMNNGNEMLDLLYFFSDVYDNKFIV